LKQGLAQEIDATLQGFADCCNWINSTVDSKVTGRLAIHKETYHAAKQLFELPANLVCQAIARVSSNRKTAKLKSSPVKKFKPTSAGYDARIFSFNQHDWTVKLTLKNGRYSFPLLIGNYQRHLLNGETPTSATRKSPQVRQALACGHEPLITGRAQVPLGSACARMFFFNH